MLTSSREDGALAVLRLRAEGTDSYGDRSRARPFMLVASFEGAAFAIENIRPGDYFVFAVRSGIYPGDMQDPATVLPYLEAAATVRLERGASAAVNFTYSRPTIRQ